MGKIKVEQIAVYAHHGCMIEEAKIGSDYLVDVEVKADISKSSVSDSLLDTVDYVHLTKIVQQEMAVRSELLEHVGKRIIDRILGELELVKKTTVWISKINPPIGGNVAKVTVEMTKKRK
ncbi:MAG: dihydroneopterin aldolase [Bacteroidetes bacterium]|jgi:dihydroneopterin aldolase|nr:dihydroneopterin aldolase [Bacteroidota bacterium]